MNDTNKDYIDYLKEFKMETYKTIADNPAWLKYRMDRNKNINEIIRRLNILDEIHKAAKPIRAFKIITKQDRLDILNNICQILKAIEKR